MKTTKTPTEIVPFYEYWTECNTCGFNAETPEPVEPWPPCPACGSREATTCQSWEEPCSIGDRLLTTLSRSGTFRRAYIRWNS